MSKRTIPGTEEAWDDKVLGAVIAVAEEVTQDDIDQAVGSQLISIRLQKVLIEDFKMIASLNGEIGYQTLMKQILQRFVDCEKKRIFRELVSEKLKEQQKTATVPEPQKRRVPQRKAA